MEDVRSRVLVVGGGVMGLGCALRLAEAGVRVELLEARRPGEGATLAALGALWPASPLARGPLQTLHRASLWEFEEFAADLARRTGMPVGFRRLGRVEFLDSEKAAERAREEARAACSEWPGFGGDRPVMEVLEPGELGRRWPGLARARWPGVVCRATAQVQMAELVRALVAACTGLGVGFRQGQVTGLETAGALVRGVRVGGELVEGDAVLVTAGAWTGLLPGVAEVAPIRPAKGQGLALRMPAGVRLETIVKAEKVYLVPWSEGTGGEVLVGSTTEVEAGFDEGVTAAARAMLLAGAAGMVPGLAGAEVVRQWAGLRPQNPAKRHPPVMGEHPGVRGLYVCAGHFKTGVGLMPRVSRLMGELVRGIGGRAELAGFGMR